MSASFRRDFLPAELVVATAVALPVPFVAAIALALSSPAFSHGLPEIDRGAAVPMRVTPVLDLDSPTVKLGGGKMRAKMPKAWGDPPRPQAPANQAHVSTKAKDDPAAAPQKDMKVASAAASEAADAGPPPASSASSAPEGADSSAPAGAGSANGDASGKADKGDPLKLRAAKLYRGRIAGWFLGRFHAPCGNLSPEDKKRFRAVASVTIGGDGTVLGFSLSPSGNADIDQAAEHAMQSAQGQQIPPPPEEYPDLRPNSTSVTFVCGS